jgi:hypothetical protein
MSIPVQEPLPPDPATIPPDTKPQAPGEPGPTPTIPTIPQREPERPQEQPLIMSIELFEPVRCLPFH